MRKKDSNAFTIVELLVVIVVIGILATITMVSYTGISGKATVASLQSDLSNATKQLKIFNVDNNNYPISIFDCPTPAIGNACLKVSSGNSYQYAVSTNKQIYCLTASSSGNNYHTTQEGQNLAGPCPIISVDAGNILSYPGTGTTWNDLSGNNRNGSLVGGVGYVASGGGAFSFNGTSSYLSAMINPIGNNAPFSMYAWFNTSTTYTYEPGIVVLGYGVEVVMQMSGQIKGWWWNGVTYPQVVSTKVCNDGAYHFIVLNYDGTIASLYIDGNFESKITSVIYNTGNLFRAGIEYNNGNRIFNGLISQAGVYNVSLSASDVLQNYNATKARYGL